MGFRQPLQSLDQLAGVDVDLVGAFATASSGPRAVLRQYVEPTTGESNGVVEFVDPQGTGRLLASARTGAVGVTSARRSMVLDSGNLAVAPGVAGPQLVATIEKIGATVRRTVNVVEADTIDLTGGAININGAAHIYDADSRPVYPPPQAALLGTGTQSYAASAAFSARVALDVNSSVSAGVTASPTVVGRLIAGTPGRFLAFGGVSWTGAAGGRRLAAVGRGGTVIDHSTGTIPADPSAGVVRVGTIPITLDLDAGEYVELFAAQTSAAALTARLAECSLSLIYLGPK
jgi:hypothetical protein